MNINEILNNKDNMYYGHGTGITNNDVINSIMNKGLRCSHGKLYHTSMTLGIGTQIRDEEYMLLKNWPHRESEIIAIVSIPMRYQIIPIPGTITQGENREVAYYYQPSEEDQSFFVMPQFIAGYYDARNDSFTPNPKYYENLSEEERTTLFSKIKQNYFNILESGVGVDTYKEITQDLEMEFGLTDEEVSRFKRLKESAELLTKINPELLSRQMRLPDGNEISVERYIQEYVLTYLPTSGYVYLNNDSKIPIVQFIIECAVFDCQEKCNGDFNRYMQENVKSIESGEQLGSGTKK